ncbi:MAG: aldo/keto reductase [Alphaproteobacteria bacterium]|nr:aldo/keto reductase [Alphaproteobacteria bacterium]
MTKTASKGSGLVRLGESKLKVSRLCLGAMMFGARTDAKEAERIVAHARDSGVNFIDTADVYALGESERIVGKLIKRDRKNWVLATKGGNAMGKDPARRGISRRWLKRAMDDSLQRLGLDHVDLWYLHRDYEDAPLEETVRAVAEIIKAGKARYWGLSNFRAWRIVEAFKIAEAMGAPLPVAVQPYYNAMNRLPEYEILPTCRHFGMGVVPYSPLARGVLTGKYDPNKPPPTDSRAGHKDERMMQTEFRKESLMAARIIKAHAEKKGMTAGQFATLWVLANPLVSSVLAGPRTLEQWREYAGALQHLKKMDAADETLIDSLVPPGHPSTPGYNDPKYPPNGRML